MKTMRNHRSAGRAAACAVVGFLAGILSGPSQPPVASAVLAESPLPVETLREQVAGLQDDTVAWRTLAWETCLLEGLRRSRLEQKPVILWIFIDRPTDDERC